MVVEYSKDEVVEMLQDGMVDLSFTKVKDGGVREMKATLDFDLIPEENVPKSGKSVDQSVGGNETVRVFDLVIKEWRSFRMDSLLTFMPIE
jgi:hypothetical protein